MVKGLIRQFGLLGGYVFKREVKKHAHSKKELEELLELGVELKKNGFYLYTYLQDDLLELYSRSDKNEIIELSKLIKDSIEDTVWHRLSRFDYVITPKDIELFGRLKDLISDDYFEDGWVYVPDMIDLLDETLVTNAELLNSLYGYKLKKDHVHLLKEKVISQSKAELALKYNLSPIEDLQFIDELFQFIDKLEEFPDYINVAALIDFYKREKESFGDFLGMPKNLIKDEFEEHTEKYVDVDSYASNFDGRLYELLGMCLNNKGFEKIVEDVKSDRKLEFANGYNKDWLVNVITKESTRQFKEEYRPILEVVLNSIDAKDVGEDYKVDIVANDDKLSVSDNGKGMSLESLLSELVVPYSGSKDKGKDIGRFGVGFYSMLGYLINNKLASLEVDTNNGDESYKLTFSATAKNAEDIYVSITKSDKRTKGTVVTLRSDNILKTKIIDAKEVEEYLIDKLHFFDENRSKIAFNGSLINDVPNGEIVSKKFDGDAYATRVRISDYEKPALRFFSQGVLVEEKPLSYSLSVDIDLPSVELTEGRDAVKVDRQGKFDNSVIHSMSLILEDVNIDNKAQVEKTLKAMGAYYNWLVNKGKENLADYAVDFLEETSEKYELFDKKLESINRFIYNPDGIFVPTPIVWFLRYEGIDVNTLPYDYIASNSRTPTMEEIEKVSSYLEDMGAELKEDVEYVHLNTPSLNPFYKTSKGIYIDCSNPIFDKKDILAQSYVFAKYALANYDPLTAEDKLLHRGGRT